MPDVPQSSLSNAGPSSGGPPAGQDMSQYIRTYAKDVAKITNQPQPASPKPAAPTAPAASPAFAHRNDADGVALPEVDESPVNRPDGVGKEFPQETLELSKEDSAGIFANRPTARASTPPPRPVSPASTPTPAAPLSSALPARSGEAELDPVRQAVLARLRERAAGNAPVQPPVPASPPAPLAPPSASVALVPSAATPSEPVAPPAPPSPSRTYTPPPRQPSPPMEPYVLPSIPASPVPPPAPRPAPPPIPARTYTPPPSPLPPPGIVPLTKKQELAPESPSPLHTYTSDFSERIDREHASTFSVLAAQQDQGTRIAAPEKKRSVLPVVLAIFLIVLGAGGLFAAYQFIGSQNRGSETLGVPSLILADEKMELTGPDYRRELADVAMQPLVEGNILVTYVTAASTTPLGLADAPQPGGALIRLLDLGAPDILLRNVDLSSTVGVVSSGGSTNPFFILRVNSFERTFAGMLGWENTMLGDLEPLYPNYIDLPSPAPVATTTGTSSVSTIATPPPPLAPQGFVDDVVANRDVRALRDGLGRTLLIYGYSDKQTLIIARDEAAFTTLVARLTATKSE